MNIFTDLLPRLPVYFLLVISAAAVTIGDYFAKKWSLDQKNIFIALAIFNYFLASCFYIPTLLKEGLVVTTVIWILLSTIGFLFVGVIIFKEPLSITHYIGVAIGIIAIFILALSH